MKRIKIGKKDLTDAQLMQIAEQIHTKMMSETTLFAMPVPALPVLEGALVVFRDAAVEAVYRDKRAIIIRNEKRESLLYILKELSKYVDTVANGDSSIVLASGFSLPKSPESYSGYVPKADQPTAKYSQVGTGRITLKTNRWAGARMYQFQYRAKDATGEWISQLSSKSSCVIESLESFKEYEFRVTYIGINPIPNYSDITSSYVL